ncbi:MAG: DUF1573 domain-containing protein [Bdellovibrionales bacterium]|jgi:hypothetical protein|nr:DUF1573 domain-containing protein [Bdellovibrionales bacterium]MBT3525820.1 DUF1573 domain-containing protein [Bdellovibrionales bacterium]MBT7669719.1 DUF1573 domain-containing protein [Bdellovibrionales bacterium]MBT7767379.1 DUF1573 domain-containing protein [Bdellovibrionales bacterium]
MINRLQLPILFILFLLQTTWAADLKKVFTQHRFNFGKLPEGELVERSVKLNSLLNQKLTILSLHSSCGCTLLEMPQREIMPHGSSTLTISMDTSAKKGNFLKVIEMENNLLPDPIIIVLTGEVTHNAGKMTNPQVMFKGRCKNCHAPNNISKLNGKPLYQNVCLMCHQKGIKLKKLTANKIKTIISSGVKDSSMAAFAKSKKGILTQEQIDSLTNYLLTTKGGR